MKFSDVMIYYNYKMTAIARALGVTKQSVALWGEKNKIPYPRQCQLQIVTNGKLIANEND